MLNVPLLTTVTVGNHLLTAAEQAAGVPQRPPFVDDTTGDPVDPDEVIIRLIDPDKIVRSFRYPAAGPDDLGVCERQEVGRFFVLWTPDSPVVWVESRQGGTLGAYPGNAWGNAIGIDAVVAIPAVPVPTSGAFRQANNTAHAWRNAANTADLTLAMDGSDRLALAVGAGTLTTSATAGAASALPATPAGYLTVVLNSTVVKIPYYT